MAACLWMRSGMGLSSDTGGPPATVIEFVETGVGPWFRIPIGSRGSKGCGLGGDANTETSMVIVRKLVIGVVFGPLVELLCEEFVFWIVVGFDPQSEIV